MREQPHPIVRQALRYGAWPLIMAGCMLAVHIGFAAGVHHLLIMAGVSAFVFTVSHLLERAIPYREDWRGDAMARKVDLLHVPLTEFTAQGLFRGLLVGGGFLMGTELMQLQATGPWQALGLGDWPIVLQLAVAMVVLDLGLYWQHRLMHTLPAVWAFHRIHHSPQAMTVVSANRNHFVGPLITACISMAFGALAPTHEVFVMVHLWIVAKGWLQHANADLRTPGFDALFATPKVHRWHHSELPEEADRNFGLILTLWDRVPWHRLPVFGPAMQFQHTTYFLPTDRPHPEAVGLGEAWIDPEASALANWWSQFLSPWEELKRQELGALKIFAWPTIVLGAVLGTYYAVAAGFPGPIAVLVVTLGTIALGLLLERVIPFKEEWHTTEKDVHIDTLHLLLSGAGASGVLAAALLGVGSVTGFFLNDALQEHSLWAAVGMEALPVWAQFAAALALLDVCMYWHHRIMHEVPAFWRLHEVHHSPDTLTASRAGRNHPIGPFFTSLFLLLHGGLGMAPEIFFACHAFLASVGLLQHVNADLRLGLLDQLFCGPRMHRWHHSRLPEECDNNFSNILALWDRFPWHWTPLRPLLRFKRFTWYLPEDRDVPEAIGLEDSIVLLEESTPLLNWWSHVRYPFAGQGAAISARKTAIPAHSHDTGV